MIKTEYQLSNIEMKAMYGTSISTLAASFIKLVIVLVPGAYSARENGTHV